MAAVENYSKAVQDRALKILNELAPLTRRDEWWTTDGPREIVARQLNEFEEETR